MAKRKYGAAPSRNQLWNLATVGIVFPVSILLGFFMGSFLDARLGTRFMTVLFVLLGIASGFVSLFRLLAQFKNNPGGDDRDRSS